MTCADEVIEIVAFDHGVALSEAEMIWLDSWARRWCETGLSEDVIVAAYLDLHSFMANEEVVSVADKQPTKFMEMELKLKIELKLGPLLPAELTFVLEMIAQGKTEEVIVKAILSERKKLAAANDKKSDDPNPPAPPTTPKPFK